MSAPRQPPYASLRRKRFIDDEDQALPVPAQPAPAPAAPQAASPAPPGAGLEFEIHILRQAMGELAASLGQARSLDEKSRLTQALSLVGERLAQMLLAEKKLTARESSELEDWLRQAANDVLAGHGWDNS